MKLSPSIPPINKRSLWSDTRRRFFRNRAAMMSLLFITFVLLMLSVGPLFSVFELTQIDWSHIASAPSLSSGHYFGTDYLGRDLFVRTLEGGRISFLIGVAGAFIAMTIGTFYGAIAGFSGGRTDHLMMRLLEILQSIPFMFLVILLVTFFGSSLLLMFVALGAVSWLDIARIVRGQTLSLKEKEFIHAARVSGANTRQILLKHIIPNLLGIVVVYSSLLVPHMILLESVLSFLGLGVQEPMSSWGSLVHEGSQSMEVAPWQLMFPTLFLIITLFCFNFLGDGLRDALDPRDRQL